MPDSDIFNDLDRLYSLEYSAHIDRVYGNLRREIANQEGVLNKKGLLQSGFHESEFKRLHLNKAEEVLQTISEIFIKIYCADGYDEEIKKSLIRKVERFAEGNLTSFINSVNSSHTLISSRKASIITDYQRELNIVVSNQKRQVEIHFLKLKVKSGMAVKTDINKTSIESSRLIQEKDIKPPSWLTSIIWIARNFNKHRGKIIVIVFLFIIIYILGIII
jgi:hypothetical protein